jgi:hypothetical protein
MIHILLGLILRLKYNHLIFFSVIDTGGVFRNVTELFWDDVKKREFNGGKLFDGDKAFLIQQNASIVEWAYPKIMGKALFWSLIHAGTWPKWLDQMHLQYIIEGENTIMCLNVLNKHIPYLYNLAHDLLINPESRNSRKNDIEYWIQHCGLDVGCINYSFFCYL